jgi:hypothetical protein
MSGEIKELRALVAALTKRNAKLAAANDALTKEKTARSKGAPRTQRDWHAAFLVGEAKWALMQAHWLAYRDRQVEREARWLDALRALEDENQELEAKGGSITHHARSPLQNRRPPGRRRAQHRRDQGQALPQSMRHAGE